MITAHSEPHRAGNLPGMASHGPNDSRAGDNEQYTSTQAAHRTGGLEILSLGTVHRSEPSPPLGTTAEPTAGPCDPAPQASPHEFWIPQLSARTLHVGGFRSVTASPSGIPAQDDLRGSIYSAWDRGSQTAIRRSLGDENGATMDQQQADDDNISLDSLQMHDEGHHYSRGDSSSARELQPGDYDAFRTQNSDPPGPPGAPADVRVSRLSWLAIWLIILSVYSTILSGIWLGVAIAQPRWGHTISAGGSMTLSTANVLTAIFAKTIELSFVTVFVAFIGQVLTKKAIEANGGMTMAEMTMRTWITQPGSLLANGQTLRYAGHTVLGVLTLIATLVAMLYTTASDTMVRPKLRFSGWHDKDLQSYVVASYANAAYVQDTCSTPVSKHLDPLSAGESCLAVQYSGDSYQNLLSFLAKWRDISYNGSTASSVMAERPAAQAMLYDNITMAGSWIETQHSDVSKSFEAHQRVINNVSLALPHPGVYKAATNKENNILQPSDLDGLGAYNISASVISPAVNVLCVNMNREELEPLVYTAWPNTNTTMNANSPYQEMGWAGWNSEVPVASEGEFLNRTVVDDIFRWGPRYNRTPPVFQLYPVDNNIITNTTVQPYNNTVPADAIYLFGKSRLMDDYTLCELRSWPAIQCSTRFDVSGVTGMSMAAHCSQSEDLYPETAYRHPDPDAYVRHMEPGAIAASPDWKLMVDGWRLAIDLNGGVSNNNASNARILTELALTEPRLNRSLPSMAEALAVLVSSTLVVASVDTPFKHYWEYSTTAWPNMTGNNILPAPGALATFHARVRTQEYASWHSSPWQGVFYLVLASAFLLNLLCLGYFFRVGLVKDFLEPTNLFVLATARPTPPHEALPETPQADRERGVKRKTGLAVPYRLAYKEDVNNYYFEEAEDEENAPVKSTGADVDMGRKRKSYYRLSTLSKTRL